jgi:signal peptidase II
MVAYGIFIFTILLVVDQIIKRWVVHIGDLSYLCNSGIAFGVVIHQYFFVGLWVFIVFMLSALWWSKRDTSWKMHIPFILIFAGALGNMIDRIVYGCVIDYIPLLNISSFNFADILISGGAFLLLIQNWTKHDND